MFYYASETINGVANSVVYGDGLTSTEASRKKVKSIMAVVNSRANNYMELWLEKELVARIHDSNLNLTTDLCKYEIELDLEIPVGQTLTPAIRCGATATNLILVYKYEEIT